MTVTRSEYNSGCLFCSALGDRGLINHHLNKFIPFLASKLKSISKVAIDEFHPVGIVKAARYNKQSPRTRARIKDEEWERPELMEWIVLTEFGKKALVPLSGPDALRKHASRGRILRQWWEDKVAEAIYHTKYNPNNFNLSNFIADVLREAFRMWYPGAKPTMFGDIDESTCYSDIESHTLSCSRSTFSSTSSPAPHIPKSSVYIAAQMAAIVMDPEDDQEPQNHEEIPPQMKRSSSSRLHFPRHMKMQSLKGNG